MSNEHRLNHPILRRKTAHVHIGNLALGSYAPIIVQSMTDTPTSDVERTVQQINELARAGSEIVRITINDIAAAKAVPSIVEQIQNSETPVPIVGDFHFNGHRLLEKHPECGQALDKLRINPGNVGKGSRHDPQFAQIIEFACRYDKPVRIGVNWGSLDQALLAKNLDNNAKKTHPETLDVITRDTMIDSALTSAQFSENIGLAHDKIVISCKLSRVNELIASYRLLAKQCDYPLHIGLTEAGMGIKGIVASTLAISTLLQDGIGDTIRVSLTPEPGAKRTHEVRVAWNILQSLSIRMFSAEVTACPGCGRTNSDTFQLLTKDIQNYIEEEMPKWRKLYAGVENMTVAVMGCVVNGPGESKHANIGISLPGSGEIPVAPVYIDGEKTVTLKGETISNDFKKIMETYIQSHYAK